MFWYKHHFKNVLHRCLWHYSCKCSFDFADGGVPQDTFNKYIVKKVKKNSVKQDQMCWNLEIVVAQMNEALSALSKQTEES